MASGVELKLITKGLCHILYEDGLGSGHNSSPE